MFPPITAIRILSLVLAGAALTWLTGCAEIPSNMSAGSFSTVVIDAGHGGKDNGGISGRRSSVGLLEKEVALDTALRLRNELRSSGVRTVMTREDDRFIELDDRVRLADREGSAAILVSIHYNASPNSSAYGAETFYWRSDSHGLATRIQNHLVAETGETSHGVTRRRLRLTRNPSIPCVLCECAYLTNAEDDRRAADAGFRSRVARGIAAGILEQRERGDAGIASVAEIYAPPSSAADKYHPRSRGHRHHKRHSRFARVGDGISPVGQKMVS